MDWERIVMDGVTVVLVAAAITTVGGFISVVVKELLFGIKTHKLLVSHMSESQSQHSNRKDEHNVLSKEHAELIGKGDLLNQKIDGIYALTGSAAARTEEIRDAILKEKSKQKERYKALSDKQKVISDGIKNISDLSVEMEKLGLENAELRSQNERLQTECGQLKEQVQALEKDNREWDKKYDTLIADANKQIASRDEKLQGLQKPHRDRDVDVDI